VNEYLGPILREKYPEVKILGLDHNKDLLLNWTIELLGNNENDYFNGMAFHW
jgi:glucosylceramidase